MALVTISAFGVIIAVNVFMAFKAVSTFPGLEVENSYVASQTFDAERRAQMALGWTASVGWSEGVLRFDLTGADGRPADVASLALTVGRSTERTEDQTPDLSFDGAGWSAPLALGKGYWQVWVEAVAADGTPFRQRLDLRIKG
jgi:nitrogen fixation protein FixH